MTKETNFVNAALLALGIGTAQAQPVQALAAPASATMAQTGCVLVGQPDGRYTANIYDKVVNDSTARPQGEAIEFSGSLRIKDSTKPFTPSLTGSFRSSSDNMVASGTFNPKEPNGVTKWLAGMIGVPLDKPEPLSYGQFPGRSTDVTVSGWSNGVPSGSCQIRQNNQAVGSAIPLVGITHYGLK